MPGLLRLIIGIPIAAIVTFGLFMLMQVLIFTDSEFEDEEREEIQIDIRPEVEELARQRNVDIRDVDQVQPPPPPPQIERQRAQQPTEGLSTIVGEIPRFEAPQLNSQNVNFSVSDRDAQPLVRIEPQYPPRALERGVEGTCNVRFDVTPDGTPTNIQILQCSSSLFDSAARRAVERWRYNPKVVDGVPVSRTGVETQFVFQLND